MWPEHARRPLLHNRLQAEYDARQLEAIEASRPAAAPPRWAA
jgi:hypothetical protein